MDYGASSYRRFLEGDEAGLKDLIENYRIPLQYYLLSITGDSYLAEEAAIETFVKLTVKKPKYSGKSSFKTWLFTIGRNTAYDLIRKERKHGQSKAEETAAEDVTEESPEEKYIKEERKRELWKSICKLKKEYKSVLWLRYYEGFPVKEIAVIIRKSEGSTKTLLSRAREALKAQLGKDGFDYEN